MGERERAGRLTIEALEQRLARAWIERDRSFIENLLAPDWTVTDPSGRELTRPHVLDEMFSSSDRRIDLMTVDNVKVNVLGDVFLFVNGQWRVVASHGTLIAPYRRA